MILTVTHTSIARCKRGFLMHGTRLSPTEVKTSLEDGRQHG